MKLPAFRRCMLLAASLLPAFSSAQTLQQHVQTEGRLDAILAAASAVQAGFGVSIPAGLYVRTGLVAGLGAGRDGLDGRLDILTRFTLDPFRQSRWAPYGGAGLSGRFRNEDASRAFLLVYMGLEGPLPRGRQTGWAPAFEIGLGGGARIGFILRRGIHARR